MNRRQRVHVRLYWALVQCTPPDHRQRHGAAQVQLFADLVATGRRPWRLWAAALPDLLAVLLLTHPRKVVVAHLARLALYPLSLLNLAAGLSVAALAVTTGSLPAWVAAPGAAIALQGSYTLTWLRHHVPLPRRLADGLLAVGEAAALVVGTTGVVAAIIRQSGSGDPEYGPPSLLVLVAVHALVALLARRQPRPEPMATA